MLPNDMLWPCPWRGADVEDGLACDCELLPLPLPLAYGPLAAGDPTPASIAALALPLLLRSAPPEPARGDVVDADPGGALLLVDAEEPDTVPRTMRGWYDMEMDDDRGTDELKAPGPPDGVEEYTVSDDARFPETVARELARGRPAPRPRGR